MKAKVTVCILTYNRSDYLKEAITSVLSQSYSNFKLYILDNCSTDNTRQIVESFKDRRISFLPTSSNIGFERNFIRCFQVTKTDYVVTLGDDDVLLPNALAVLVDLLETRPHSAIGRSAGYRFFKHSNHPDLVDLPSSKGRSFKRGDDAISNALFYNLGSFTGLIIRKSSTTGITTGNGMLGGLIDPLFFILKRGGFVYTPHILFGVRCHENLAYKIYEKSSYIEELFPLFDKYIVTNNAKFLAKNYAMSSSINDLYNIRIFGGFKRLMSEIKNYVVLMPETMLKPKFFISICIAVLLPAPCIKIAKKIVLRLTAPRIRKKYPNLFTHHI